MREGNKKSIGRHPYNTRIRLLCKGPGRPEVAPSVDAAPCTLTSGPDASGSTWKGLWKLWHGPLRVGSKGEWKLQPSECNCLALSLPNTLRDYKHQWREKDLISKDIKFSELCDLWENKASWENDFLKLERSLQERGHQNTCKSACPILLDSGPWEEPRPPDYVSPGLE